MPGNPELENAKEEAFHKSNSSHLIIYLYDVSNAVLVQTSLSQAKLDLNYKPFCRKRLGKNCTFLLYCFLSSNRLGN